MNKAETEKAIKVMQAYADGKEIQFKRENSQKPWKDFKPGSEPIWDWYLFEYRVKPEPIVRWAVISPIFYDVIGIYTSREEAKEMACGILKIAKLVEEIEDA